MKFKEAVDIVSEEPLFETGLLLAGNVDPIDLRRQLSRWTRSGRIHQLRRGLYVLAPPWRKQHPHPFLVANRLAPGSYVSGLSALALSGVIPEYVAETTSVTAGRPELRTTPLGRFSFRHLKDSLMFGCTEASIRPAHPDSLALTSRFRLTPCSAASVTRFRCVSGGTRTMNLPL